MKIKAFTTVVIRIMGLVMLSKVATVGVSVALLLVRALRGASGPSGRWLALRSSAVALTVATLVPIIAGIICLAYSKALTELLTKGIDTES